MLNSRAYSTPYVTGKQEYKLFHYELIESLIGLMRWLKKQDLAESVALNMSPQVPHPNS